MEILAHLAWNAFCGYGRLEPLPDFGIFILVFDLMASLGRVCHHLFILRQLIMLGQPRRCSMTRRTLARSIMSTVGLVESEVNSPLRLMSKLFAAVGPHERVAFAFQNQNVRAGPMAMSLFVEANSET